MQLTINKINIERALFYCMILLLIPLASSTEGITIYELLFLGIFSLLILLTFHNLIKKNIKFYDYYNLTISILIFSISILFSSFTALLKGASFISSLRAAYPFLLVLLVYYVRQKFIINNKKLYWVLILTSATIVFQCIFLVLSTGHFLKNPYLGEAGTAFNSALYLFVLPFFLTIVLLKRSNNILYIILIFFIWRILIDFRRQPLIIFITSLVFIIYFIKEDEMYYIIYKKKKKYIYGIFLFIISLATYIIYTNLRKLNLLAIVGHLSFDSILLGLETRFAIAITAFKHFLANPVIGIGLGKEVNLYGHVNQTFLSNAAQRFSINEVKKVHNLYLYILLHGGIILFSSFLYFIYKLFFTLKKLIKCYHLEEYDFYWCVGSLVFLANYLILGMVSVRTISLEAWLLLAIIAGITLSIQKKYNNNQNLVYENSNTHRHASRHHKNDPLGS